MSATWDQLAFSDTGSGDVARDQIANPPLPLETPDQTDARQNQDAIAVQRDQLRADQQFKTQQRMTGAAFAAQGVPTYSDSTGAVQPVTDTAGKPLTNYDKKNSNAWDSLGNVQKISYDGTPGAPPVLSDPYENAPTTTDKEGNIYKVAPGLPWKFVDQDDDVIAANAQKEKDAALAKAATAIGGKLSLDQHAAVSAGVDYKAAQKQFQAVAGKAGLDPSSEAGQAVYGGLDDGDPAAAHAGIDAHFNSLYAAPEANATAGLFSSDLSPAAQQLRAGLDADKATAHTALDRMMTAQARMQGAQARLDATQQAAEAVRTQNTNARLAAAGLPTLEDQQKPGVESSAGAIPGLDADGNSTGGAAATSANSTPPPSDISPAVAAKTAKAVIPDIDTDPVASLNEAVKQGVIPNPPEAVWQAAREKQQLIDAAGSDPKIKAVLQGVGRFGAFTAAAPIGAGIATAIPGVGEAYGIGQLVGGLITGSIGAWGYGKLSEELAKHNDTINSFVASEKLYPNYALGGELAGFAAGVPRALMKGAGELIGRGADAAASASAIPGETVEAVRAAQAANEAATKAGVKLANAPSPDIYSHAADVLDAIGQSFTHSGGGVAQTVEGLTKLGTEAAKQGGASLAAQKVATRLAVAAGSMAAIDTVLKEGGKALGFSDQGQTLSGAGLAALMGAFTAGHGIDKVGYDNDQIADIMRRGWAHDFAFNPEARNAMGLPQNSGDKLSAEPKPSPLTPEEQEIYSAVNQKAIQLVGEGRISADPATWRAKADQILVSGRKVGVANADIEPDSGSLKAAKDVNPSGSPGSPGASQSPGAAAPNPPSPSPAGQSPRPPSAETDTQAKDATNQKRNSGSSTTPIPGVPSGQPSNDGDKNALPEGAITAKTRADAVSKANGDVELAQSRLNIAKGMGNSELIAEKQAALDAARKQAAERTGGSLQDARAKVAAGTHEWIPGTGLRKIGEGTVVEPEKPATATAEPDAELQKKIDDLQAQHDAAVEDAKNAKTATDAALSKASADSLAKQLATLRAALPPATSANSANSAPANAGATAIPGVSSTPTNSGGAPAPREKSELSEKSPSSKPSAETRSQEPAATTATAEAPPPPAVRPALVDEQGKVVMQGSAGDTHAGLKLAAAKQGIDATDAAHAFTDASGNVLDRVQAAKAAVKARQISPQTFKAAMARTSDRGLHSEDLKPSEGAQPATLSPAAAKGGENSAAPLSQPAKVETPTSPEPAHASEKGAQHTEPSSGGEQGGKTSSAKLPAELAGAKPRYAYGPRQFDLNFASDFDRAAYIAAQKEPSKRDADYVAFAKQASGLSEDEVRRHGMLVRAAIKGLAKNAGDEVGTLTVPKQKRKGVEPEPDITGQPKLAERPKGWRKVGVNSAGNDVEEDENGVRSHIVGNIRIAQPVSLVPTRGAGGKVEYQTRSGEPTGLFQTTEETNPKNEYQAHPEKAPAADEAGGETGARQPQKPAATEPGGKGGAATRPEQPAHEFTRQEVEQARKAAFHPISRTLSELNVTVRDRRVDLSKRDAVVDPVLPGGVGIHAEDFALLEDPKRLAEIMSGIAEHGGDPAAWMHRAYAEEEAHLLDLVLSGNRFGKDHLEWFKNAPEKIQKLVQSAYPDSDNKAELGLELVRMLDQITRFGDITESYIPGRPADELIAALRAWELPEPLAAHVAKMQTMRADVPGNISWAPELKGVGEREYSRNGLRFTTHAAAERSAKDTFSRWMGAEAWRVRPCGDVPNRDADGNEIVATPAPAKPDIREHSPKPEAKPKAVTKTAKAVTKPAPALDADAQAAKDALGDLLDASNPLIGTSSPIAMFDATTPPDKRDALNKLAAKFLDEGRVTTPEALARTLAQLGPKAMQYSQNIWRRMQNEGAQGDDRPAWANLYAALAKPEEQPTLTQDDRPDAKPDVQNPADVDAGSAAGAPAGTGGRPARPQGNGGRGGAAGDGGGGEAAEGGSGAGEREGAGDESNPVPAGDAGGKPAPVHGNGVGKFAGEVVSGRDVEPGQNLRIQPEDSIEPSGRGARIKANLTAIRLLRKLETNDREATPEEKRTLAKFTGWGSTFQVFGIVEIMPGVMAGDIADDPGRWTGRLYGVQRERYDNWAKQNLATYKELNPELGGLLSKEEFESAKESSLNAHFTERGVIGEMWQGAKHLGFPGGVVVEPSAGIGHFMGLIPDDYAGKVHFIGIELEETTARMLKKLYPKSDIQASAFEKSKRTGDNTADLVITNFPFGKYEVADIKHPDYDGWSIHNYFLARSVDMVRPGGLVMAITSRYTLDALGGRKMRDYIGGKAALVGAMRLPDTSFEDTAGTKVVTDLLVFRKQTEASFAHGQRFGTATEIDVDGEKVRVNEYYAKHPEMVLGTQSMSGEMNRGKDAEGNAIKAYTVKPDTATPLTEQMRAAFQRMPGNVFGAEKRDDDEKADKIIEGVKAGAYTSEGKKVFKVNADGVAEEVFAGQAAQAAKARAIIGIREELKNQIQLERDPGASDEAIAAARANLNRLYDAFVAKHGALNAPANDLIDDDPEWPLVAALEDETSKLEDAVFQSGKRKGEAYQRRTTVFVKGHPLLKRFNQPRTEPTAANTLEDAIAISMSYRGGISPDYIGTLLGLDTDTARTQIIEKTLAFENPSTGLLESPDIYLSGRVREKLATAKRAVGMKSNRQITELKPGGGWTGYDADDFDPETKQYRNPQNFESKAEAEKWRDEAAEGESKYQRNVEALEKVQPAPLPAEKIHFRLGANWIEPKMVERFLRDTMDVRATVTFARGGEATGWVVDPGNYDTDTPKNIQTWGGGSYELKDEQGRILHRAGNIPGHELVGDCLNLKMTQVSYTEDYVTAAGNDATRTIKVPGATMNAREMQKKIQAEFRNWVLGHAAEAQSVEEVYNRLMNGTVVRKTPIPAIERFPGANEDITLNPWQKRAAFRALQEALILAHSVGTGKTYTLITIAQEMKRLGIATKPLVVVQNATIGQFARSYKRLYPAANLLVGSEKKTKGENRAAFIAQIATREWDAVIIPQSFFERIENDPQRESDYIHEQLAMLEAAILEAEAGNRTGDALTSPTTTLGKQLLRMKKKYEARLERTMDRLKAQADNLITFENLGVDALLVDEAHTFKRGDFFTKMDRIKGLDTSGSARSMGFLLKTQWIHAKTPDRNVVLATGTPISNTLAEMWTMARYVKPNFLKAMGVESFDDFAGTFTEPRATMEETPTGDFREVLRLARYANGPEITAMWRTVADVYQMSRADLPGVPLVVGGGPQAVILERTALLGRFADFLKVWRQWYEELEGREKVEWGFVPVYQFTLARKAAIDMRLIHPGLEDDPGSKTNRAVEAVFKQWQEGAETKATQLLFSSLYQSHDPRKRWIKEPGGYDGGPGIVNHLYGKPVFNLFDDMRKKLIARGVPASEIANFADMTKPQIDAAAERLNTGAIRIAFGTTETLGTGLNIQTKIHDISHVDTQFRPMDEEQRNGRGIRQGNENKEIAIWKFGVKRTMDSILNDLNAKKQGFITQSQTEDLEREFEDPADDASISFQAMAAAFSGNPKFGQLFALRQDVRNLQNLEDDWGRRRKSTRDALSEVENGEPRFEAAVKKTRATIKAIAQHFPEKTATTVRRTGGEELTGDAAKAELEAITAGTLARMEAQINDDFASGALAKQHAEWLNHPTRKWFGTHTEKRTVLAAVNGVDVEFNLTLNIDLDALKEGKLALGYKSGSWKMTDEKQWQYATWDESKPWFPRTIGFSGSAMTGAGFQASLRSDLAALNGFEERVTSAEATFKKASIDLRDEQAKPFLNADRLTEQREKLAELEKEMQVDTGPQETIDLRRDVLDAFPEFGYITRQTSAPETAAVLEQLRAEARAEALKTYYIRVGDGWEAVKNAKPQKIPGWDEMEVMMHPSKRADGKMEFRVSDVVSGMSMGRGATHAEALERTIKGLDAAGKEKVRQTMREAALNGMSPHAEAVDASKPDLVGRFQTGQLITFDNGTARTSATVTGIDPVRARLDVEGENGKMNVPMRFAEIAKGDDSTPPAAMKASNPLRFANATLTPPGLVFIGASNPLRAFHGTPHDVDEFSLDKVGTGEGAQVYGWGLYFAENAKVGEEYARQLGKSDWKVTKTDAGYEAKVIAIDTQGNATHEREGRTFPTESEAKTWARERAQKGGNTYTVALDVEPEELLDWDKPLSEQSAKVKAVLKNSWAAGIMRQYPNWKASDFYDQMVTETKGDGDPRKKVSEYLQSLGIPGIRYLDQGSRNQPSDLTVEKIREGVFLVVSQRDGSEFGEFKTSGAAHDFIDEKEAAIRTYNYVLFDDSKIKITAKNGQPVSLPSVIGASNPLKYLKEAVTPGLDLFNSTRQGVQSLILPSMNSPEHLKAAETLGSKLGPMNRRQESARALFKNDWLTFEKAGVQREDMPLDKNPGVKFMSDMSTGRAMSPEMQAIATKMDAQDALRLDELRKADAALQSVRENYFPGVWTEDSRRAFNLAMEEAHKAGIIPAGQDVNDATPQQKAWVKQRVDEALREGEGSDNDALAYITRRPFKGKESFRKQKLFDEDILTAFEFGLRPVSYNPVDIKMLKWAEMDRNIMANQAIKEWKAQGKLKVIDPYEKVPDGWQKINDKYGTIYGPPTMLGLPIKGYRIVPDAVGDVLNNYLSSSIYNNRFFGRLYTAWMGLANALNKTQLGVSAFHAGFTTMEAQISALAGVIQDVFGLARGNRSLKQLGASIGHAATATVTTPSTGDQVLNAWRNPDGTIDPRIAQVVRAIQLAGGGFTMERGMQTDQMHKTVSDYYGGKWARAALRSPVAAIEAMAWPIMSYLVPRQKAGVFAQMAWRIIEQNPGRPLEELTAEFRQAWNRVDARLGQVRYDRLFMHNIAKNLVQGTVRAPGWSGGTIAELGGGFKDIATFFVRWKKGGSGPPGGPPGQPPNGPDDASYNAPGEMPKELPPRAAYALALLLAVFTANALLTWLFTGEHPHDLDYWAFRTGGKDEHGRAERFVLPTYMKDLLAYAKEPLTTLAAKSHPLLSLIHDLWVNKDYYGVKIRNEDDGALKQAYDIGKYFAKAFEPFWIRGAMRERERNAGPLRTALPMIGVMPAPKKMTQTPAEKLADDYMAQQQPAGARTQAQADTSRAKYQLTEQARRGEAPAYAKEIAAGHITARDIPTIQARAAMPPLAYEVKKLPLDRAEAVWRAANPQERREIGAVLAAKRENAVKRAGSTFSRM